MVNGSGVNDKTQTDRPTKTCPLLLGVLVKLAYGHQFNFGAPFATLFDDFESTTLVRTINPSHALVRNNSSSSLIHCPDQPVNVPQYLCMFNTSEAYAVIGRFEGQLISRSGDRKRATVCMATTPLTTRAMLNYLCGPERCNG
jgi:hypothetical protein